MYVFAAVMEDPAEAMKVASPLFAMVRSPVLVHFVSGPARMTLAFESSSSARVAALLVSVAPVFRFRIAVPALAIVSCSSFIHVVSLPVIVMVAVAVD